MHGVGQRVFRKAVGVFSQVFGLKTFPGFVRTYKFRMGHFHTALDVIADGRDPLIRGAFVEVHCNGHALLRGLYRFLGIQSDAHHHPQHEQAGGHGGDGCQ